MRHFENGVQVSRCPGNVIIARSELSLKASAVRDVTLSFTGWLVTVLLVWQFVVGVGARDQEGALRALSMAFVLARAAGDGRGANVVIIYVIVVVGGIWSTEHYVSRYLFNHGSLDSRRIFYR